MSVLGITFLSVYDHFWIQIFCLFKELYDAHHRNFPAVEISVRAAERRHHAVPFPGTIFRKPAGYHHEHGRGSGFFPEGIT